MEGTDPFEYGTWTGGEGQGKRNDLKVAVGLVKEGGLKRVAIDEPELFVKFHRGLAALEQYTRRPGQRETARTCYLVVGDTGIGKTRWVFDNFSSEGLYVSPVGQSKNAIWFDGYSGEKVALLDDFRGSISYEDLLKLCDPWYDHRVPIKGGYVIWKPDTVIITSNTMPCTWYSHLTAKDLEPLNRRLARVDPDALVRAPATPSPVFDDLFLEELNVL